MQILTMTGATPKGIPQPKIWPRRHYDVERPHETLDTTNQQSIVVPGFMGPPWRSLWQFVLADVWALI